MEDEFPFQTGDFQVQHVNFPGENPSKSTCQNLRTFQEVNFPVAQLPNY